MRTSERTVKMDLKLKEKNDDEVMQKKTEPPKRSGRSIAELASLSTLSKEELDEANENVGDNIEYSEDEYDDGNEGYDEAEDTEGEDTETEEEPKEENEPPMEHYGRVFSFEGKPSEEDVFRFMFYHTYCSVIGVFAVLIVIASVVMAVWSFMDDKIVQGCIFAGVFLFFIINSPLSLKKRAKKQSESMSHGEGIITYTFSDAGFDMKRMKEYAPYKYDRIMKVVCGKTAYYVYLGKMRAFLCPKADLGANEETFLQLIRENVKNFKG